MIPSIDNQIGAMQADWPMLKLATQTVRSAAWRGPLKPYFMTFEIGITYTVPLIIEVIDPLRQQPRVRVLNPILTQRPNDPEGDLPHVYWDDPKRPSLCLFDFETRQWSPFELISKTTVPWTIDWLICYEGWRATGKWTGGGRHAAAAVGGN